MFLEYLLKFCKRMSANWNPTEGTKDMVNRVMSILIRLRMHISDLHQKGAFPYSPKALLKVIESVEFCYDLKQAEDAKNNVFDLDYINYVKKKAEKKAEEQEKEKINRESRKSNKPKKMVVHSVFLQDIQYEKQQKLRKSQIDKKRKEALAKRKRKKSQKEKTKMNMLPIHNPDLDRKESVASFIMKSMKSNRGKNKESISKRS